MRLKTDNRFHKLEVTMRQVQADVDDMKEVTKKELFERANEHEEAIFQIKKALEQHGIKWTDEPKLKQLDQSVFDGLDAKWRFAMVSSVGIPFVYDYKPSGKRHFISDKNAQLMINLGKVMRIDEYDYDTTNWQNSLIERESKELTGNDYYHSGIASRLLERGQKLVVCFVSNLSEADAINKKTIEVITSIDTEFNDADDYGWQFVVPINNQGEPLTQSEAGL